MARALVGSRVREYRIKQKMTQNALAKAVGISPSYLNLIEHNRRGIAGRVLLEVARVLRVATSDLTEGPEIRTVADLREAVGHLQPADVDPATTEEFAGRFPGWAALLTQLYRRSMDQEAAVRALSDRLTHDPFLAENLHNMLSKITAIRSTSSILTSVTDIPLERQQRFHQAIHTESRSLSDAAKALLEYFDHATESGATTATPEEEVDQFLGKHNYTFPEIDANPSDPEILRQLIAQGDQMQSRAAQTIAKKTMETYREDAHLMPLPMFQRFAKMHAFNPAPLARMFSADMPAVFRRLATLKRDGNDVPEMGLIIVNAAGQALHRRPIEGFPLPRHGNACPLWPVFHSFSQPNRPLLDKIDLPDEKAFFTISVATPRSDVSYDRPPDYLAAMLIIPEDQAAPCASWIEQHRPPAPVGTSCRICPRADCISRTEISIISDIGPRGSSASIV